MRTYNLRTSRLARDLGTHQPKQGSEKVRTRRVAVRTTDVSRIKASLTTYDSRIWTENK